MSLAVLDTKNKKVRDIELAKDVAEQVNKAVLYYAVKAYRNNLRHGTASAKDRSEVNKTNKKIYRQKGTGNARHGARKANIFVGGGSAHGPKQRSYFEKLSKKFKETSYREVLKYLIQNDSLKVLDAIEFKKTSTKAACTVMQTLKLSKALLILPRANKTVYLSFRNIRDVKVVFEDNLNLYDMLRFENVVVCANYFEKLKERYGL